MTRWISEHDVTALATIPDALETVRQLLKATAEGRAECRPRQRVRVPGALLHGMIGGCEYLQRVGWKQYLTTREAAQFLVGLYDTAAGQLLALLEANRLGQLRTGAMTGVAARVIYGGRIRRLAVIGCGWQAESQVAAICETAAVEIVSAYCRTTDRRVAFCNQLQEQTGCAIEPAPDARTAVKGADVVVCITTSREPVVRSEWLDACRLLVAAGSNAAGRAEFPPSLLASAARVICDDVPSCRIEAGELIQAAEEGTFRFEDAVPLAEYFGPSPPPPGGGLQVFKSVGIASADVAMADFIYRRAVDTDRGLELPIGDSDQG